MLMRSNTRLTLVPGRTPMPLPGAVMLTNTDPVEPPLDPPEPDPPEPDPPEPLDPPELSVVPPLPVVAFVSAGGVIGRGNVSSPVVSSVWLPLLLFVVVSVCCCGC